MWYGYSSVSNEKWVVSNSKVDKMIREIIIPREREIILKIPEDYINREVELIVFPIDEQKKVTKNNRQNISSLAGSLSKYANPDKIELEDRAWGIN